RRNRIRIVAHAERDVQRTKRGPARAPRPLGEGCEESRALQLDGDERVRAASEGSAFERAHVEMFAGELLILVREVRGGGPVQRRGKVASRTVVPPAPRPEVAGRRSCVQLFKKSGMSRSSSASNGTRSGTGWKISSSSSLRPEGTGAGSAPCPPAPPGPHTRSPV